MHLIVQFGFSFSPLLAPLTAVYPPPLPHLPHPHPHPLSQAMGYGLVLLDGNVVNINKLRRLNIQRIDRIFKASTCVVCMKPVYIYACVVAGSGCGTVNISTNVCGPLASHLHPPHTHTRRLCQWLPCMETSRLSCLC